ncbi:MAG: molybdopterin-dependent oxidoreductase [Desulfobacterales bacterium]|nr:molybdopterin-dependent oxidoreductase [Desulfobacterales bacterium]
MEAVRNGTKKSPKKTLSALEAIADFGARLFGGKPGALMSGQAPPEVLEDVWVPSVCNLTNDGPCGIKVHRVNGVTVKIEGNKAHPNNEGVLCPKGHYGILKMYDSYRIKSPLKRTNPEKGIGVDPRWMEISWDEALDITAEKLKKIYLEDPRKLEVSAAERGGLHSSLVTLFGEVIGTPNLKFDGGGIRCSSTEHVHGTGIHAAFTCFPDIKRCNYSIYFGRNPMATHGASGNKVFGEARARGLKMVVIDPVLSVTAAKAEEWIPIKSGTDGAVILSMINVIINELNTYDAAFLKQWTNAPYLVGADGYFLRKEVAAGDKVIRKPLVWDAQDGQARVFDDPDIRERALLGDFDLEGGRYRPAFQLLQEHVRQYTPEWAAEISQVPAETIRRLSAELVTEARIGSTIMIDGKEFPFRPAATKLGRGVDARQNSSQAYLANEILNMLVGNVEMPGGHLGGSGKYKPRSPSDISDDGTLKPHYAGKWKFPPDKIDGSDTLFYYSYGMPQLKVLNILNPEKLSFDYRLEGMIRYHSNGIMSIGDHKMVAEALKKIPFFVSFSIINDEMTEFADIVLPDAMYLERWEPMDLTTKLIQAGFVWQGITLRQPIARPLYGCREIPDILTDLAERMEILDKWNMALNRKLQLKAPYLMAPDRKYEWVDVAERMVRSRGVDWEELKQKGAVGQRRSDKTAYMLYDGNLKFRLPLYFENLKRVGEELKNNLLKVGIDWWDTSDYVALPYWRPSVLYSAPAEYDMVCTYHRSVLLGQATTVNNPYCIEALEQEAYITKARMNPAAAMQRGIRDGEYVYIESQIGKVKARAALSEGIFPNVIAIGGAFGQWATPIARDLGWVNIGAITPIGFERTDPLSGAMEGHGLAVKVYKA